MGMSLTTPAPLISLTICLQLTKCEKLVTTLWKDAELLADSPFVDIFFGMQPIQQEIENSPLEELLTSVN